MEILNWKLIKELLDAVIIDAKKNEVSEEEFIGYVKQEYRKE